MECLVIFFEYFLWFIIYKYFCDNWENNLIDCDNWWYLGCARKGTSINIGILEVTHVLFAQKGFDTNLLWFYWQIKNSIKPVVQYLNWLSSLPVSHPIAFVWTVITELILSRVVWRPHVRLSVRVVVFGRHLSQIFRDSSIYCVTLFDGSDKDHK